MTKLILTAAIALAATAATTSSARADFFFFGHHHHHGPSVEVSFGAPRSVYVIEHDRPVQRVVYVDNGRYFRVIDGRRVYLHDRVYTSYPSHYYYPDGRRRVVVVHH
jgi:hypothetical protein